MSSPDASAHSDEELVQRVAEGDVAAYRELLRRHGSALRNFAQRLTKSSAEAEDVLQETFLRLWQSAGQYSPKARAKTWLFRIAHNISVDRLRARRRTEPLEPEQEPAISARQPALLDEKQRALRLASAIEALPERQAAALTLVHLEGLSGTEAAQVLDVSQEALESLLSRARRALKAALMSEDP